MRIDKRIKVLLSESEKDTLVNAKDIIFALYEGFDECEEFDLRDECDDISARLEQLFEDLNHCDADIDY